MIIKTIKFGNFFKESERNVPPPGSYDTSKFRKHKPADITFKSRHGGGVKDNGVPGPGFYKLAALLNGTGFHVNSKYKSANTYSIKKPSQSNRSINQGM